jgi:hypothetical protein
MVLETIQHLKPHGILKEIKLVGCLPLQPAISVPRPDLTLPNQQPNSTASPSPSPETPATKESSTESKEQGLASHNPIPIQPQVFDILSLPVRNISQIL